MMIRLLLGVALAANILLLVESTGRSKQATATSVSPASTTSSPSSSHGFSSSSPKSGGKSNKKKCRKVKKCLKNEELSYCLQSLKRAQNCSEEAEPSTYRAESDKPCIKGCVCKENYLRAENGTCIPADQCPLPCGANEVLDDCPTACESDYCPTDEEDTLAKPCVSSKVCRPACKCAFNHRRAANGTCIPTRECPSIDCNSGPNQEYATCPPLCPTDDCSQASPTGECPRQFGNILIILPCNPKCRCIKDYWRLDGICVPYGECPGVCPDNERYSTCVQAECRALNCTQKDQSVPCIRLDPQFCQKGCVCEEGYLRNKDGICVLEDKCEPSCPANEEFVQCIQGVCRAKNCSERGQDVPCPDIPTEQCDSGCICKEGFLRAEDGTCVSEDQCEPSTCPKNEEFTECTQIVCRAQKCIEKDWPIGCPSIATDSCIKGCVCQNGYLRDETGICIPDSECKPNPCKPNEEFSNCTQATCRTLNCSDRGKPQVCAAVAEGDCETGCVCQEGYSRTEEGYCVPTDQCDDNPCPFDEVLSNCTQAVCRTLNCSDRGKPQVCAAVAEGDCETGCVCKEGYLRNKDGICVLEDKCEPPTCPENEEYSECTQVVCRAQKCIEKDWPIGCPSIATDSCLKGCVCQNGYLRDETGICIPDSECKPNPCKPNEEFSNCTQATCRTLNCSDRGKPQVCAAVAEGDCETGCVCQEGYSRTEEGYCVPTDQCDDNKCPLFEEWHNCANAVCKAEFCTHKGRPVARGSFYCCQSQVGTNSAHVDNPCPFDEVLSNCTQAVCRTLNCSDRGKPQVCAAVAEGDCETGCVCKEGYLRNKDGICVLEDKCEPPTCPENEEYSECTQVVCRAQKCIEKDWPIVCPSIATDSCIKGCVCQNGYLRDETGICIPDSKCKTNPCKPNEEFSNCTQATCRTLNCSDRGKPQVCAAVAEGDCETGCVCQEGYSRTEEGYCVPTDQCDDNKCPLFEEWHKCANAVCKAELCTQKGRPVACPSVSECVSGCLCRDNYLRDESGFCVPEENCAPDPCPFDEVLSNCTQAVCRTLNCSDRGKPQVCAAVAEGDCETGCVCKEGYLRVDEGYCVPRNQCDANKCPLFEEWSDCANAVCSPQNCSQKGLPMVCPSVAECVPGCLCRDNYLRDESGFCVYEEECPNQVCPANEEWSKCAQATCRAQNCTQRGKPIACPGIAEGSCEEACVCKEGFLRNASGDCIPQDQCLCGDDEVLDDCPMMCNTDYCPLSDGEEQVCTQADPCVPTCKCRFNYKRAINGTCIPTRNCPAFDCPNHNEEYVSCPPYCPTDECGKPRLTGRCPFRIGVVLQCKPKCQCKDGYGRTNGTCVPLGECPDICPTNEVYSPCVQQTCRPQNCTYRDLAMETCPTCDAAECQRGCVCKENYYRNDKGVCISYEECGGPMCSNAHEVFDPYFTECPSNTCESLTAKDAACDDNQKVGPGCRCEPGYLRSKLNEPCIPICDCDQMKDSADCSK